MEGIELADSLLYRDFEASKHYNKDLSNVFEQFSDPTEIQTLVINDNYESLWKTDMKSSNGIYHGSNSCISSSESKCDMSWLDSMSLHNHFNVLDSKIKSSKINFDVSLPEMDYSSIYFRPISENNCEKLSEMNIEKSDQNNSETSKFGALYDGRNNERHKEEHSLRTYSNVKDNARNNEEKELISSTSKTSKIINGLSYDGTESLLKNIDLSSHSLSLDTVNILGNLKTDPSLISLNNRIPLIINSSSVTEAPIINMTSGITAFNTSSSLITQGISSITSLFENTPIINPPPKSIGTTITIPQGSYIFIPFTVPNYPVKEINHSDLNIPLKQITPLILPKHSFPQNIALTKTDMAGSNETTSHFHASYISNVDPITKSSKKKAEYTEFNYYFNIISDSHKMLLKEKNKIIMDKYLLKDESIKNVTNYAARNNNNMNKLEKELNMLINLLFEINVLISKIESLRGISFVEPFYNILQNAAELIQSFQTKDIFPQYFTRIQNCNKHNEKVIEMQIEKLKRLLCDIQEIRTFLWASYTNLSLDRECSLSCALKKLKSWSEMKNNLRKSFKLTESNVKTQIPSTTIGETTIPYKNISPLSSRSAIKFDRTSIAVQTQSFAIPVSQYPAFPNRVTTILQRFPNQQPPSLPHYNYIQTSISNYTHPTLINNSNFPINGNCRLSYGSQQQIYATTPLNGAQTQVSPRNFIIASSSMMTPILYQNRSRPIINNTPINFMVYKTNPQIM